MVVVAAFITILSPLDIVRPASTAIAAASGSSTFILLLGPTAIHSVPHLPTVGALVGFAFGVEGLGCIFSLDMCLIHLT